MKHIPAILCVLSVLCGFKSTAFNATLLSIRAANDSVLVVATGRAGSILAHRQHPVRAVGSYDAKIT